ncbi:class I SAM-dependent methyltransferase [Virgibacillus ainsalahensis]
MWEKDNVRRVFSKSKEAYVTSSTHAKGSDLPLLIKWLEPKENMKVLDIATGGGHTAKYVSHYVKTVIATDLTKEMLENTARHLRACTNIEYVVADAEDLPFLNNTFDIVTCRIAAHHFPNPEAFISEVQRVLNKNGKFLFIDNIASEEPILDKFINRLEKMRDYSHVRSLKISEWKQILHRNNLSVTQMQLRKKTLPFEEWLARTLTKEEAKTEVRNFILDAAKEIQDYFQIKIEGRDIQTFTIDEWMILCQKK